MDQQVETDRLATRIRQLAPLPRQILCWHFGIAPTKAEPAEQLSSPEVGRRLQIATLWVRELKREALAELAERWDEQEAA